MEHAFLRWTPASIPWLEFNITTIYMIILTCILAYAVCSWFVKGLSVNNPSKKQIVFEMIYGFIKDTVVSTMDMKRAEKFISLAMTLFVFIFIANFLGIPINIAFDFKETTPFWSSLGITEELIAAGGGHAHVMFWMSPTANISVTIAMAIAIVLMSHYLGIRARGGKKYVKHFFEPNPVFFPIHVIEEGAKIMTLGFRLYGNIYAKEVLIFVILTIPLTYYYSGAFLAMTIWQGFGMFVGTIQAFVFTVLSMVYIGTQTNVDH